MRRKWIALARALGTSFTDVVVAELEALAADLKATGRRVGSAAALFLAAAFVLFWMIAALAYAAIELLVLWLPRWGAALTLTGLLLLVALVLAAVGWLRIRRAESPAATVRRRWEEHRDWWHRQALPPADGADEDA